MKKILTVVGARPQFVKAAMLSRSFRSSGKFQEVIVHTGQHFDHGMSDVFFDQLGIPAPAHLLGISGGGHGEMTGRMLCALEPVMAAEAPDMVLVYGDTNSTLAGALVASKLNIPVVHVEAGLRSFNRRMPEEINRIMTDHLAAYLFCPTDTAMQNLKNEGVERGSHLVGDIMFDAALHFGREARASIDSALERHFSGGNFVLATIHRQENTDDPNRLERIVAALVRLSRDIPVLLPLHPRTRGRIEAMGLSQFFDAPGLSIVPPLGYFDMLALEQESALILTDSGGVQKEAYFFKVPCVTLRDQTEWGELVRLGWNRLVDVLNDDIAAVAKQALGSRGSEAELPYGEGDTAERIVKILDAAVNV